MSHIKMYKSGKFWVSSAVATLGAAAALVGGAGTSAQADATDANAQKAVDGSADVKAPETDEAGHVQVQISAAMAQNPTNVDVQTATPEAQDATTDASADTESASNESSASTADDVKSDAQNTVTETPAEAADVKADAQSGATESQDVKPDDQSAKGDSEDVATDEKTDDQKSSTDSSDATTDTNTNNQADKSEVQEPSTDVKSDANASKDAEQTTKKDATTTEPKAVTPAPVVKKTTVAKPKAATPAKATTAKAKPVLAAQTYNYSATQKSNAIYIYKFFSARGWSRNAIAGMLGNMAVESYILPDITEIGGGGGYGLVQWTPASKLINWCRANGLDYRTMYGQCMRIQYEFTHGIQYYPGWSRMTASQYMKSKMSAFDLAMVFMNNYERPYDTYQPNRGNIANYWYNFLASQEKKTGYQTENGKVYYYDNNGNKISGFRKFGNNIEYYNPTTKVRLQNGYVTTNGNTYFFGSNGAAISGFRWGAANPKTGYRALQYYDTKSHIQFKNKWLTTNGNTYFFDGKGWAEDGFRTGAANAKTGYRALQYFDPKTRVQYKN
ncbi:phage tail tip lysozyme, partial [Weissella viridescens]